MPGGGHRHRFRLQATFDPDQLRGLQIAIGSARLGLSKLNGVPSMSPPLDNARWNHEAKVLRYRKLLKTYLTETERRFVERRLVEEKQACSQPIRIDQERQRPSMPTQSKAD
jgi:hypothetical protein